jgi:hypothetical protein
MLLDLEDNINMVLQNVRSHSPSDTASYPQKILILTMRYITVGLAIYRG